MLRLLVVLILHRSQGLLEVILGLTQGTPSQMCHPTDGVVVMLRTTVGDTIKTHSAHGNSNRR